MECFSHHNRVDHNLLEGKIDGGTGAAPYVLSSYSGLPMKQALAVAEWTLKCHQVVLFASDKVATPIEIAVAIALGADAIYIWLGDLCCHWDVFQALECHANACPTGITTQNSKLEKALDIKGAAKRVATYADALYKEETQMLAESRGYESPSDITPDDIMVITLPGHLDYLSELHGPALSGRKRRRWA